MKTPDKPKATQEEKTLDAVSGAQWSDYVARFRPAEAALIKKAELTQGEINRVQGEASADTASAFKGLTRDTIARGEQTGANVNSGKTKLGLAADASAAGEARGVGQAIAKTGAVIDSEQQKLAITAHGRNIATDTTADISAGARTATRLSLAASEARFQKNQATLDAVSSVAGAATRKGQLLYDKYTDGLIKEQTVTSKKRPVASQGQIFDPRHI